MKLMTQETCDYITVQDVSDIKNNKNYLIILLINYYFGEFFQYQSKTELLLVSSQSKSLWISRGNSSHSWVLVHALDLIVKKEF